MDFGSCAITSSRGMLAASLTPTRGNGSGSPSRFRASSRWDLAGHREGPSRVLRGKPCELQARGLSDKILPRILYIDQHQVLNSAELLDAPATFIRERMERLLHATCPCPAQP